MKFYEFGKENEKTIMLLPGNLMTHRQYEKLVPMLDNKYHIITVSFDGFDETGETTYTTAEEQANKLAKFIKENLNGRIDLVYAESLGGCPATYLTRIKDISIGGIIISGTSYWNLGIFNNFARKTLYKIPYKFMSKAKKDGTLNLPNWLLKSMGRSNEELQSMLSQMCVDVTSQTMYATFSEGIDFYLNVAKWEANTSIPFACWYGEKESNMKKAIKELKRAFPNIEIHSFKGLGHGEIVNNEDILIKELEIFMNKYSI